MNWKLWLLCLMPFAALAQDAAGNSELTLEKIMQDPTWIGEIPTSLTMSADGRNAYFTLAREVPMPAAWKCINLDDGTVTDLDDKHRPAAFTQQSYYNGNMRIDEIDGDLWIADGLKKAAPLIANGSYAMFVRFLGTSSFIFLQNEQLLRYDMLTGSIILLTDLRYDQEDSDKKQGYLEDQERKLLKHVEDSYRLEAFREEQAANSRKLGSLHKPTTAYLGKDYVLSNQWVSADRRFRLDISPDQDYVALVLEPKVDEPDSTEYANFINREASMEPLKERGRVSHKALTYKAAVVRPKTGEVSWVDFSDLPEIKTDRLALIKESLTEEQRAFLPKARDKDEPRPVQIVSGGFDGDNLLLTLFSRDCKDRWIVTVNVRTMAKTLIFHQYDPAWVQLSLRNVKAPHPVSGNAFWAAGGGSIAFLSDTDGNQHLYTYNLARKKMKQMTKGKFQVFNPFQGSNGDWYLHANKEHPGEIHFYRLPSDRERLEKLTNGQGHHSVHMSGDEKVMLDMFSTSTRPPHLRVRKSGGEWQELYDGRSDAFKAISWLEPEVLTYKNRTGGNVYARLYKPAKPNGAAVVFTHGAGYLQNAHKGWSSYFREFMYNNLLVARGYTVLDPDYQASAGYGRDWRTAIYRHMGGRDLDDVLDGARFLVDEHDIDPARLGTYGGSYGGFLTFMAMFTSPDTFQAGAALRPVSDWAHYNHWYTSRILNTPEVDPNAYRMSSPIYFADGLKGKLLICHGMVDGNVQYIDSVRLAQRFIELGKKDWEIAAFPVEEHSFVVASSWYDEYRRIDKLFSDTLRKTN